MKALYDNKIYNSQIEAEKALRHDIQRKYPTDYVDIWSQGEGTGWRGSGYYVFRYTPSGKVGKKVAGGRLFCIRPTN